MAKNIDGSASSVVGDLSRSRQPQHRSSKRPRSGITSLVSWGFRPSMDRGRGKIREPIVDGVRGQAGADAVRGPIRILGTSSNAVVVDKYRAKNIHVDGDGDGRTSGT